MAITLTELLERVSPEVEKRVKDTRERTQSVLRDALRSECRLVFKTQEDTDENRIGATVPVEVAPGHPEVLQGFEYPEDYRIALTLARYRNDLEAANAGVPQLLMLHADLLKIGAHQFIRPDTQEAVKHVSDWVRSLLEILENKDPLKRILAFNEDILGVYAYSTRSYDDSQPNKATIRLYWGIIGLVSEMIGCSVDDLTIVVLTHELAHAYTQIGADIEGRRWKSSLFAKADVELKEGLAQYYTERVLIRFRNKYPRALEVFYQLSKKQHAAYRTHEPWSKDNAPEALRRALLEIRRLGEGGLIDFTSRYDIAKRALRRGNSGSLE
jgi:hypothetical protein